MNNSTTKNFSLASAANTSEDEKPMMLMVSFFTIFGLIIILGFFGNIFVLWAILSDVIARKSSINTLLINLAIADLGNLLFCAPDGFILSLVRNYPFPAIMCPILRFLQISSLYSSCITQVIICGERFFAICYPFSVRRLEQSSVVKLVCFNWVVAFLCASPYALFMRTQTFGTARYCYWTLDLFPMASVTRYKLFELLAFYIIPLVVFSTLYCKTSCVLWGSVNPTRLRSLHSTLEQAMGILRLRRSVVKMLVLSLVVYFLCYSPIQGKFVAETLFNKYVKFSTPVLLVLNTLTMASSAANPFIYTICCEHFRLKFFSLFRSNVDMSNLVLNSQRTSITAATFLLTNAAMHRSSRQVDV